MPVNIESHELLSVVQRTLEEFRTIHGDRPMILIIDDDRDIRDVLRQGLETLGYEVGTDASGLNFRRPPGSVWAKPGMLS